MEKITKLKDGTLSYLKNISMATEKRAHESLELVNLTNIKVMVVRMIPLE